MSDKIFSYSSRGGSKEAVFESVYSDKLDLLFLAILSRKETEYAKIVGNNIKVAKHEMHEISQHLIANGWSLGV